MKSVRPFLQAIIVGGLFFILSSVTLMVVTSIFILPMTEHGLSQHEVVATWLIDGLLLLVSVIISKRIYRRNLSVTVNARVTETETKLPNQAL